MAGVVAHARLREQRVAHLDVAVEEHPLPRDQHVVEHADRVGLLEARAERMVPHALRTAVERLAADEAQARRRARNAEGEHVALLAVAQAGLRIDQKLVGGRAVGGEHLGAAHDQPVLGLLDHAEMREFALLLVRALRAVGLRIDDGVSEEQVAVAAIAVVVAHVLGEALAALAEELGALGERHQHGVEIVRRTADQPERRIGPDLHALAALDQVGVVRGVRNELPASSPVVLADVGHHLAMLGRTCRS